MDKERMTAKEMIFGQSTKFWPVETFNWPICQFYDLIHDKDSRLNLDPPYQRGLVWDLDHKIKLIDSVISGLGIPSVYIRMNRDYSYEVIDGKQRIHTLTSFMDDAFPYNGKLYSEHDEQSRRAFEFGTTVGVTMLKFITDADALEIYNRINFNGVPHEPRIQRLPAPGNIRKEWDLAEAVQKNPSSVGLPRREE